MLHGSTLIGLIVLVTVLLAAYWAYNSCRLNKHLATKYQKKCAAPSSGGSFVGAMAQHPYLVPLAFPTSSDWMMNRGTYA